MKITLAALAAVLAFFEAADARQHQQQHGRRTAVDLHSSLARRSLSQQADASKFKMVKKSAAARPSDSSNAQVYGAVPILNPGTAPVVGLVARGASLGAHNGEQGEVYSGNSHPALKNYKDTSSGSTSTSSGSSSVATSGSNSGSSSGSGSGSTSTSADDDDEEEDEECDEEDGDEDEDEDCEEEDDDEDDDEEDCEEDDDTTTEVGTGSTSTTAGYGTSDTTDSTDSSEECEADEDDTSSSTSTSTSTSSSDDSTSTSSSSSDVNDTQQNNVKLKVSVDTSSNNNNNNKGSSSSSASSTSSASSSKNTGSSTSTSSGSPSGKTYKGISTWYTQNGNAGHCGKKNPDDAKIIALYSSLYGSGEYCGKTVMIKNLDDGTSTTATVADSCPSCNNENNIDLSVGAFKAIDPQYETHGIRNIEWWFTD